MKDDFVKLSIVTATVGRETLNRAVESVNHMLYKWPHWNVEHLICGDGINPETVLLVDNDRPHQRVYKMPKYGHEAHVRNDAIKLAKGQWIMCLDDDDAIDPHVITYLVALRDSAYQIVMFPQTLPITDENDEQMYNEDGEAMYHIIPKTNEVVWGNVGVSYAFKRDYHVPYVPSRHEDLLHLVALEARGNRIHWVQRHEKEVFYYGRGLGYNV